MCMCIGSNSVNQAQDLMAVKKFNDLPNKLIPTTLPCSVSRPPTATLPYLFTPGTRTSICLFCPIAQYKSSGDDSAACTISN